MSFSPVVLFSHVFSLSSLISPRDVGCFVRRVFLSALFPLSLHHMPDNSGLNVFTCSIAPQALTVRGIFLFFSPNKNLQGE